MDDPNEPLWGEVTCGYCDYRNIIALTPRAGHAGKFILLAFLESSHVASQHPNDFRRATGQEPAAVIAQLDQNMAAMGFVNIEALLQAEDL